MQNNQTKVFESEHCILGETVIDFICKTVYDSLMHLDNITYSDYTPFQEEDSDMATKINRSVYINGEKRWVHANTEQEYADKLQMLFGNTSQPPKEKHNFSDYAMNWFETYSKPNIQTVTVETYERQIRRYLIPHFGEMAIEDITLDDVQRLFNGMTGSKATKTKAKQVLSMIFNAAVEDKLVPNNPLDSKRLKITGNACTPTEPYSVEQMQYLTQNLGRVKNPTDRAYIALQALHPLRLEEVLGLKWEDIDVKNGLIHIRRAVTHPRRNRPEIKQTKTESSARTIGLSQLIIPHLDFGAPEDFVCGGKAPLSYTKVRDMCKRIQADTGFSERVTPIRFRTTVLTDIYEQTHDIKLAQTVAGHTTPAMTLKYYVKGRGDAGTAASAIDRIYGAEDT